MSDKKKLRIYVVNVAVCCLVYFMLRMGGDSKLA